MNRLTFLTLGMFSTMSPAWADGPRTDDGPLGPVSMEWEGTPTLPPPHAWVGAGVSWATNAQTQGGPPWGAGIDFTWVTLTRTTHHTLRFSHRTWRAPSQGVEDRLKIKGVKEGVQSYWAGRMALSGLNKVVNASRQTPHLGLQAGWRLQRTQHVGETTQKYLLKHHDLYWGPQWTAHIGPELQAGYFKGEEALQVLGYGRALLPLYAQLNDKGEGIVLNGKMWDPVQTVSPEGEAGVSLSGRVDPYFIRVSAGIRSIGPSVRDSAQGQTGWQTSGTVDLAVSKAF